LLKYVFFLLLLFCSCSHRPDDEDDETISEIYFEQPVEKAAPPPLTPNVRKEQVIILDAGHGGNDRGAEVEQITEKRLALFTTLMTKKYLEAKGYKVILTRAKDTFIPLERRVDVANKSAATLFVSIHYNASKRKEAKGIEVFYNEGKQTERLAKSRVLAESVLKSLIDMTKAESRGVKKGNFRVTRETTMPAILVEGGFITNKREFSALRNKTYLSKIALGIAEGIDQFALQKK
jgi:N-acetylmuramoyl-L-alanine amidase